MGTDTRPVRIRPSLSGYRRTVVTPVQIVGTLLLGLLAAFHGGGFALALVGSLVLCVALPIAVWVSVARLWTTELAVHRRVVPGRTRVVPRDAVASVLWLPGFHAAGNPPTGLLVLLDTGRRPLLRLEGLSWGPERLAAFAPTVGAPVTVVESDLTPAQLAWRTMYDLPLRHRHPTLIHLVTVAGLVGALLAARGWR